MTIPLIIIGGHPDDWGLIISFLDTDDPRSAVEQFDTHYGWHKFEGFTMDIDTKEITYGEGDDTDPPLKPISKMMFRNELIILYDHAWVAVMQPDLSWQMARMD